MKRVVIIDGQGGKLGRQLVERVLTLAPACELVCVGTNGAATAAMLKGGAKLAATGENAVIVACRRADVIAGPVGILCADALMGEITCGMAAAVGASEAAKVLIPMSGCRIIIAGMGDAPLTQLLDDAAARIARILSEATI